MAAPVQLDRDAARGALRAAIACKRATRSGRDPGYAGAAQEGLT